MAKRQTRRSFSINGKRAERVKQFAAAHNIPAAQLVEQGIDAVLDGRIQLTPAIVYSAVGDPPATRARRAHPVRPPAPVVRIFVAPRTIYPGGTCACCISAIPAGIDKPIMVPWGRGNAQVRICESCSAGGQAAAL